MSLVLCSFFRVGLGFKKLQEKSFPLRNQRIMSQENWHLAWMKEEGREDKNEGWEDKMAGALVLRIHNCP